MLLTQGQWVDRYLHILVWLFRLILEDQLTYQSRYIPSALVTCSKLTLSEIYIFFVRLEFWHVLTIRYPWMIYIYMRTFCVDVLDYLLFSHGRMRENWSVKRGSNQIESLLDDQGWENRCVVFTILCIIVLVNVDLRHNCDICSSILKHMELKLDLDFVLTIYINCTILMLSWL